jgi:hypothetical protein
MHAPWPEERWHNAPALHAQAPASRKGAGWLTSTTSLVSQPRLPQDRQHESADIKESEERGVHQRINIEHLRCR